MSAIDKKNREHFLVNSKGAVTLVKEKTPNVKKLLKGGNYNAAYSVREFSPKSKFLFASDSGGLEIVEEDEKNTEGLLERNKNATIYKLLKFAPSKKKGRRTFLVYTDDDAKLINVTESEILKGLKSGKYKTVYNPQEIEKLPERGGYFVVKNDTPNVPKRPRRDEGEKKMTLRSGEYRKRQTIYRKIENYSKIKDGVRCLVFLDYVGNPAQSFFAVDSKTKKLMEDRGVDLKKLGVFVSSYLRRADKENEEEGNREIVEVNTLREKEALDAMMGLQSDTNEGDEVITSELINTRKRKRRRRGRQRRTTAQKRNKPNPAK